MTKLQMASFSRTFSAAHRIAEHGGHCSHIHGHNYLAMVEIEVDFTDDNNMTLDFGALKAIIDYYDHKLILDRDDPLTFPLETVISNKLGAEQVFEEWIVLTDGPPSTEFMAQLLADEICAALPRHNTDATMAAVSVILRETDSISAMGRATWEYSDEDDGRQES